MIKTSTGFAEQSKKTNTLYKPMILYNGKQIPDEVQDFVYEGTVADSASFSFGTACSQKCSFSINNPTENLTGKELEVKYGTMVNGQMEYIRLGYFTCLKPEIDRGVATYTLMDRMSVKMGMPYFPTVKAPTTDIDILKDICKQSGVALSSKALGKSHTVSSIPNGYTYREMLCYIAQMQGCNAVINSDGELELRWYASVDYVLDDAHIYANGDAHVDAETPFSVGYVACIVRDPSGKKEDIELRSGTGAAGITLENPMMTQAILDDVYSRVSKMSFYPAEFEFCGDFRLELGDIVKVVTGGENYNMAVMEITHKCSYGLVTTISSVAQTSAEDGLDQQSPVTKEMDRYYANLVTINKALINKLDVETAKITYATIKDLQAETAKIDKLEADKITVDQLDAAYARIDKANIETGWIDKAMIAEGAVGTVQIADGSITDAKIVGLTANKITAGRIDASDIEVVNLKAANITVGKINGKQIEDGAIGMDNLGSDVKSSLGDIQSDVSDALKQAGLANTGLSNLQSDVNEKVSDLQSQIDGAVNTWTGTAVPTTTNYPASDWRTDVVRATHIGDIYYIEEGAQNAGYAYRYQKNSLGNYGWVLLKDSDVTKAVQDAAEANKTAEAAKSTAESANATAKSAESTANGIVVGGRNLIIGSDTELSATGSTDFVQVVKKFPVSENLQFFRNKSFALSMDFNIVDAIASSNTSKSRRCGLELAVFYTDSSVKTSWLDCDKYFTTTPLNYTGRLYTTEKTKDADVKKVTVDIYIQGLASGTVTIGRPKIEFGNKATDWTPAPEDTDKKIEEADKKAEKATAIANGKSTAYYSTSKPTGGTYTTNDVWYDTDDGYKMYFYNGKDWTAAQIGTNAIAAGSVTTELLNASAVTAGKIATGAVTADKIAANAVTADKILANAITAAKIATNAVEADKIAAGAVTADKIAANAVEAGNIKAGSVSTEKIAAGAITSDLIAANAITADKIVSEAVTADKIAAGAVTTNKILANAVTADKIDVANLFAQELTATNLKVTGESTLSGVSATDLTIFGESSFNGDITAKTLKLLQDGLTFDFSKDTNGLSIKYTNPDKSGKFAQFNIGENGINFTEVNDFGNVMFRTIHGDNTCWTNLYNSSGLLSVGGAPVIVQGHGSAKIRSTYDNGDEGSGATFNGDDAYIGAKNGVQIDGKKMSDKSDKPIYTRTVSGEWVRYTMRLPDSKVQIAWMYWGTSQVINTAWGSGYESSQINMGNWEKPFNSLHSFSYSVGVDEKTNNTDCWLSCYRSANLDEAGKYFINRQSALATSRKYWIYVIGIGTYE